MKDKIESIARIEALFQKKILKFPPSKFPVSITDQCK